jgi:hypothetical protein
MHEIIHPDHMTDKEIAHVVRHLAGISKYQGVLLRPTVAVKVTHGSNEGCPLVQNGHWTYCKGHEDEG